MSKNLQSFKDVYISDTFHNKYIKLYFDKDVNQKMQLLKHN